MHSRTKKYRIVALRLVRRYSRFVNVRYVMAGVGAAVVVAGMWAYVATRRPPEFRGSLTAGVDRLTKLALSPDAKYLAAGSATGDVVVWELATRRATVLEPQAERPIVALRISADGFVAAGSDDWLFVSWQFEGSRIEPVPGFDVPAPVTGIAFRTSQAKRLEMAIGLSNGTLAFLDESGFTNHDNAHPGGVKHVVYDSNGERLVTAGADGKLTWHSAETRQALASVQAHNAEIGALVFSRDDRRLASGDWNGEIKVWQTETRELVKQLSQPDAVSAAAWADERLVTASWDGNLRIWTLDHDQPQHVIDTGRPIHDLVIDTNAHTIITVANTGAAELWRMP